jgi:hypothetical protein
LLIAFAAAGAVAIAVLPRRREAAAPALVAAPEAA